MWILVTVLSPKAKSKESVRVPPGSAWLALIRRSSTFARPAVLKRTGRPFGRFNRVTATDLCLAKRGAKKHVSALLLRYSDSVSRPRWHR